MLHSSFLTFLTPQDLPSQTTTNFSTILGYMTELIQVTVKQQAILNIVIYLVN
jgi:hypothetical protein